MSQGGKRLPDKDGRKISADFSGKPIIRSVTDESEKEGGEFSSRRKQDTNKTGKSRKRKSVAIGKKRQPIVEKSGIRDKHVPSDQVGQA